MAERVRIGGVEVAVRADTTQANRRIRRFGAESKRAADKVEREFDQANRSIKRIGSTARSVAPIIAGIGLGVGFAGSIGVLADFSQAMSTVKAITQATEVEFASLETKAKELGATTRFSATQAAEGMLFLARAGFDTNQVLGSIEGTLNLAQAGALDLGRAADIASNILQGFRLEVNQTQRVVDVLALAANSSNTSVEQLGEAMKFVAPVAAGMGVSIEEATAAAGALSDAGLQASLAGTGLRRVLSELEAPTRKSQKLMAALGVNIAEVRPSSVGLTAALQRLADAGVDTALALEIFGDRGGPAFEVLSSSLPKVRTMTSELQNAEGTAKRVAETMDDNLKGSLLAAASALEALVLALGDLGAELAIRSAIDAFATAIRSIAGAIGEANRYLEDLASKQQFLKGVTETLTDATEAYEGALFRAARAQDAEREAAEQSLDVRRRQIEETIKSTRAKLKEAQAELALAEARAFQPGAGENIRFSGSADGRALRLKQEVAELQAAIANAEGRLAGEDAVRDVLEFTNRQIERLRNFVAEDAVAGQRPESGVDRAAASIAASKSAEDAQREAERALEELQALAQGFWQDFTSLAKAREIKEIQDQLEVARANGNKDEIQSLERRLDLERRIAEYKELGYSAADARERAIEQQGQVFEPLPGSDNVADEIQDALDRLDWGSAIRDGSFGAQLQSIVSDRFSEGANEALNQIIDIVFDIGKQLIGGSLGSDGGFGAGLFTSVFGGARASGGRVRTGVGYTVGERGPERFVPTVSGIVLPNEIGGALDAPKGERASGMNVSTSIVVQGDANAETLREMDRRMAAFARSIPKAVDSRVADRKRRNAY